MLCNNFAPVAQLDSALGYGPGGSGFKSNRAHQKMNILNKKINKIIILSFLIKSVFVIFYHEKTLSDEWAILFQNFQNFKSYSFYIFDGQEYLALTCPHYIFYSSV